MSTTVKMSKGYNINFPKAIIEKMNFSIGEELVMDIENERLVLVKKPGNYTAKLRGLHKEVWEGIDADEYVTSERDSWG
ncbi:MAG: hypothetical protein K0A90_07890 [Methanosarcinaceae archaeon]|nr:hypothetical protein [Methanosarcinaceae archaeon]